MSAVDLFLKYTQEGRRILSDQTLRILWWLSGTHTTAVTVVTVVVFHPYLPPEAVHKQWMTHTNNVIKNPPRSVSLTRDLRVQDHTKWVRRSNIRMIKMVKCGGRCPRGCSTDVI